MNDVHRAVRWAPGTITGVGLGAMLDGLVFHELLQWHNFLSDVPGLGSGSVHELDEHRTADGLFHLFAVVVTAIGFVLTWRAGRRGELLDGRLTTGSVVMGVALFNLFDGVVVHLVLSLHHLYQDSFQLGSDLIYIAANLLLFAAGALIARSGARAG